MPLKEKELRKLKSFLDQKVDYYNQPSFIPDDPISIPHRYSKKQDIEIAGFWTAMLSWGQRKTILNKSAELMELMDDAPHDFIINHEESDRKRFLKFKHRTFQADDTLYLLSFFQDYYRNQVSLESAFIPNIKNPSTAERLSHFHHTFFSLPDLLQRTRKHVNADLPGTRAHKHANQENKNYEKNKYSSSSTQCAVRDGRQETFILAKAYFHSYLSTST